MKNPNLLNSIRKYWYLCFLYIIFSYLLIRIIVIGSSKIADATDSLFAGENIALLEFMIPFIMLMLMGGGMAWGKSYSKNTFSICMQTDIRNMLVSKLVKIRIPYFDSEGTGTLMNKLLSDMYQIETLFAEIGVSGVKFVQETGNETFHPGRCAKLVKDGKVLGIMGQLHPRVASAFKIGTEVYEAEIDVIELLEISNSRKHYVQLPKFPATNRDIAVVVNEKVNVGEIEDIIEKNKSGIIESFKLFDVYRGIQLGINKKSVAYSIVFRAADRTLTDDEVNGVMQKIVDELKEKLDADLRL